MSPRPYVADQWQSISYKTSVFGNPGDVRPPTSPTWVDDFDARRLAAYTLLAAWRENASANWLPDPGPMRLREVAAEYASGVLHEPADPREKYREYGHGGLLVATGRSLLLGDDQTLDLPAARLVDDNGEPTDVAKAVGPFAEWLNGWADAEMLLMRLHAMETNAVGDGDGVLALGWDAAKRRPRLRKYDPGLYFPDLTDDELDWPRTVHVAWEITGKDKRQYLRRQTWTLADVDPWQPAYAAPGDEKATVRCVKSDVRFDLRGLRDGDTVYTLDATRGEALTEPVELPIDFLPVVHVPNDPDEEGHFGRSLLLGVAQILDDLAGTDTDLQAGSALAGSSPVVTKGVAGGLASGPGAQWNLPADGDARMLDTSRSLSALLEYDGHLLDVLAVNSRIAAALLGRVTSNDATSGYMLDLRFRATTSLVREMRLVRAAKYPLLLKMVQRFGQAYGVLPKGPTPRAELLLGPYLPADKTGAAQRVASLLPVHGMSVRTAVQELMTAGFAVDDAEAEVRRILSEWGQLAVAAVDATGDVNAARRILGLPETAPAVPPGT